MIRIRSSARSLIAAARLAVLPIALLAAARSQAQVVVAAYANAPFDVKKDGQFCDPKTPQSPGILRPFQEFTAGSRAFRISLQPVVGGNNGTPQELRQPPAGGPSMDNPRLRGLLGAYRGWTIQYQDAQNRDFTLTPGSLRVKSYTTQALPGPAKPMAVGAELYVEYRQGIGDPPKNANLHWVQALYSNWSINGVAGDTENLLDTAASFNPYYDDGGCATPDFFWDAPLRLPQDGLLAYDFAARGPLFLTFDLFLAQEIGRRAQPIDAGTLRIYDGMRWGFRIDAVPEPGLAAFAGGPAAIVLLIALRRASRRRQRVT